MQENRPLARLRARVRSTPHAEQAGTLVEVMLDRFVLGLRRDGSSQPPTAAEVRHAEHLARAWEEHGGFDVDEVREWLDHCPQITPDVAAELVLAGVSPEEAAAQLWLGKRARYRPPLWSRVQFREITPWQAAEEVRRSRGA